MNPNNPVPAAAFETVDLPVLLAKTEMCDRDIRMVSGMCAASPARTVGGGALLNVTGSFESKKNRGERRTYESHSCELVCLLEQELDPDILRYWCQVPCAGIRRRLPSGRWHTSARTVDVLALRRTGVTLIECKTLDWLQKQPNDGEWIRQNGRWTNTATRDWAETYGMKFDVWTPPQPNGIYRRNLEAVYALRNDSLSETEHRAAMRTLRLLRERPVSIGECQEAIPDFTHRIAAWLISQRRAFGLFKSFQITDLQFRLFHSEAVAKSLDETIATRRWDELQQPKHLGVLTTASNVDLERGRKRMEHLAAIELGDAVASRRDKQLLKQVRKAESSGTPRLEACLTHYCQSGNRLERLTEAQRTTVEATAALWFRKGGPQNLSEAMLELDTRCGKAGIQCPSPSTLYREIRKGDAAKRAMATGGMRAFQSVAAASDPRFRTLHALGYGHTLHVDSTKLDVRVAAMFDPSAIVTAAGGEKGRAQERYDNFYVGVDEATDLTMCFTVVVGPARTDALAALLRDYVARNGFLPRVLCFDRGPENCSKWVEAFCTRYGITLQYSPTAASRYNSEAERILGLANHYVSHKLLGSTQPDKKGRKVDGKFKSIHTAKHTYAQVIGELENFFFNVLANKEAQDGRTPLQRRDDALAKLGPMGIPHRLDDEMRIETSQQWTGKITFCSRRGVRLGNQRYMSDELLPLLRDRRPDEVRVDCVNPAVVYTKFGNSWIKAFRGDVQATSSLPTSEQRWGLMTARVIRGQARLANTAQAQKLEARLKRARALAGPSTAPRVPVDLNVGVDTDWEDEESIWTFPLERNNAPGATIQNAA